jgi:hypothetical protein
MYFRQIKPVWKREKLKWEREKKFQTESYMRYVITPAQTATKKDILITGRYAQHVPAQDARIKNTVHQQGGWGATLRYSLCSESRR